MKKINKSKTFYNPAGFTAIELLLVIATVGTMGVVAIPKLLDYRQEAKEAATEAIEQSVASAIKLQAKNKLMRCGGTSNDFPSIDSLRANDITVGADCSVSAIGSGSDRKFLATDSNYPPRNPLNGLNTIQLVTDDPAHANFHSGTCSTSPDGEAAGWCYSPETGSFWASTNSNFTANAGNPIAASSSSASVSSTASSSSVASVAASSSSSSVASSSSVSSVASSVASSSSSEASASSEVSVASSSSSVSSVASAASSSSLAGGGGGGGGSSSSVTSSSSSSSSVASSSSSSSSVASSSSSSSSVASSSSSSSSVASSSSSSSSVASSSSSLAVPTLYGSCNAVPEEERVTVQNVSDDLYDLPEASSFTQGASVKYCVCKPQGGGYSIQSPSETGLFNGNGHAESFFILASACD